MVDEKYFSIRFQFLWLKASPLGTQHPIPPSPLTLENTRKRMSDSCSRPVPSSCPISFSFLVCFEWFKTWWVRHLGLCKTSLYFKGKDATTEDFKLKILIFFYLWIIKCLTPLHQTSHIFLIPLPNWAIFMVLEVLDGRLQMFFELQKQRNNVWGFDLLCVLKYLFMNLSILIAFLVLALDCFIYFFLESWVRSLTLWCWFYIKNNLVKSWIFELEQDYNVMPFNEDHHHPFVELVLEGPRI